MTKQIVIKNVEKFRKQQQKQIRLWFKRSLKIIEFHSITINNLYKIYANDVATKNIDLFVLKPKRFTKELREHVVQKRSFCNYSAGLDDQILFVYKNKSLALGFEFITNEKEKDKEKTNT